MSLVPVPFFSSTLFRRQTCFVYLPPGYESSDQHYPTIYLLHGLYGSESDWTQKGGAEATLDRLLAAGELRECIVVMPNDGGYGHGTFYLDWYDGTGNFEQYITDDLVPFIDSHYRTLPAPESRAIGGLSMGGFGAFYLALRHPELFGAASSLSGAIGSPSLLSFKDYSRSEFPRMLGPVTGPYARERDLARLVEQRAKEGALPQLHFTCGTEDYLYPLSCGFKVHLEGLGVGHEYTEYPGAHTWDYWSEHLPETLRFMEKAFAAKEAESS
ncbi:alpha/beta hydrolase family protein [Paenibacillus aurantius]|uniref:Alpha/beta hydrolase family protein n=1 Tax=Paenibacillus aurantius TaxID=2918900 RepID=A0AA96LEP8_9BACL|nr:alpha/beta hydrolase family protein [Paenibacillus aurantius]WNQ11839.1 alpha/beta hydrolase family protein [Paenibacillus aurantius]